MTEPKAKPVSRRLALIGPMPPYRGGIAHFTETMRRGLSARGHDVLPVSFRRQYPSLLFPGKTQYETGAAAAESTAPRLVDSLNPLSWRQTVRHVAARAPEAALLAYWMPFFAPALGTIARGLRRRGVRVIAVVHNALPHERRPGDVALSRYFFAACDGAVTLSEAVSADVERLRPGLPVRRVAHPVYDHFGPPPPKAEARARLGLPAEAPVLLFFGFVRRYKGLHVLLEAMRAVARRLPEVVLVVAGEFYDDEAPYRAQVRENDLERHVRLHARYLPAEDVPAYFAAADLVVQPYLSATQSGVVQVAYHFERPVVVTRVGGLDEVVPDGVAGLVVPPGDPAALAEAVVRFFEEDLGTQLAEGVRREKARYSWDRLYEAVETLIPQP